MAETDRWQMVLDLKNRIETINYELARTNRFIHNPFGNKTLTAERRKRMWENAVTKKAELEAELIEKKRMLAVLVEVNKKIAVQAEREARKAKREKKK